MKFSTGGLLFQIFWLALVLFPGNSLSAQSKKMDSLTHALITEKDDSNKVNTLNEISDGLWGKGKYDTAMVCANNALQLAERIGFRQGVAKSCDNMGIIYGQLGDYPKALEYFFKALKVEEEMGNKNGIARNTGNIGIVYRLQADYPKALEYFFKALKLYEELGVKNGIAINTGNIGVIYEVQGDYPKALEYDFKALEMMKKTGNKSGIATNTGNIGNVYSDQANQAQQKHDIAGRDSLNNKAVEYHYQALKMYEEMGNKHGIARNMCGLGEIFTKQKKYKPAKTEFDSSLAIAKSIREKEDIRDAYGGLAELDSTTGDTKNEVEHYKMYILYRDSLINETSTSKSVQTAMNFTFEQKQAAQKAEQDKKDAVAEQGKNQQMVIRNFFIGGFVLLLVFVFFIFRGYIQKQKANRIIGRQKTIVEAKQKEILDSIHYAQRIQKALLTSDKLLGKHLSEYFILNKPKDIISGDFYWMERVGDNVLVAAADCTGHGVPGAMVSVVCSNALNRAVKEFKITEPGKILDKVRELVLETFEHSEEYVQDGMDISLCSINIKTNQVKWSGAYNSLWFVYGGAMNEVLADKQPIGRADNPEPFTTHDMSMPKGSILYLFTDGYADQFGGPKGKKFMAKQMQDLLLANASKSMEEQRDVLDKALQDWKGSLEQIDDILVIGIRV